jgi:hypothetical protein
VPYKRAVLGAIAVNGSFLDLPRRATPVTFGARYC